MSIKKLNAQRERFAFEYVKDLNATQAAIRAGYSERTARSIGQRLLTIVAVAELITKLKLEITQTIKIDAAWMLKASVDLYSKCMEGEQVKDAQGQDMGAADRCCRNRAGCRGQHIPDARNRDGSRACADCLLPVSDGYRHRC